MADITASMVKELREKTGAGMLDVKNALVEAEGDMERATEILRQKGIATAEKKSGRVAAEGLVQTHVSDDGKKAVLLELNCETDFVARGDEFQGLASTLAETIFNSSANDVESLLNESMGSQTVNEFITEKVGSIKENLSLRRFTRFELSDPGFIQSYIHTGSKIGVMVEIKASSDSAVQSDGFKQLAKDLAMQVASSAPEFVSRDSISKDYIEAEKRVEMGKEDLQSKPEEIREKIVQGRVDKLLSQRILLEQQYIKDPSKTITELLQETSKDIGGDITVTQFVRYVLGEGIEKKQDNFVEEVMAQVNG